MKKDNYRDYAVEAMRYYAACDRPDSMTLKKLREILPPGDTACFKDLDAVERMLRRLENEEYGRSAVRCVEIVYFSAPFRTPTRGEITERVRIAAKELCICESYVYRALHRARTLVALERGLRVEERALIMPKW